MHEFLPMVGVFTDHLFFHRLHQLLRLLLHAAFFAPLRSLRETYFA